MIDIIKKMPKLDHASERLCWWLEQHGWKSYGMAIKISEVAGVSKSAARNYVVSDVLPRTEEEQARVSEALCDIPVSWWRFGDTPKPNNSIIDPNDDVVRLEFFNAVLNHPEASKLDLGMIVARNIRDLSIEFANALGESNPSHELIQNHIRSLIDLVIAQTNACYTSPLQRSNQT